MSDNSRQVVARKPFSEVLDAYFETKSTVAYLRAMGRNGSVRLREAENDLSTARQELDDYLNEKE